MTVRDIQAQIKEMFDIDVSPDLISKITDSVLEEVWDRQARPLDRVYPVIFLGALACKVGDAGRERTRRRTWPSAWTSTVARRVLGIWVETTEGVKFWLRELNELKARGKISKTRWHFPNDDALIKLLYLGCRDLVVDHTKRTAGRGNGSLRTALNQFDVVFPGRPS